MAAIPKFTLTNAERELTRTSLGYAPPRGVLFDFDGTLVDTTGVLAGSMAEALRQFGHLVTPDHIRAALGPTSEQVVMQVASVEQAEAREIVEVFGRLYAERHADAPPHAGAEAVLATLRDAGLRLGVVTNNPQRDIERMLISLKWHDYFTVVVGGDSGAGAKPEPGPALHALRTMGSAASEAAFVGDTVTDMRCASSAAIPTRIALLWDEGA